MSLRVRPYSHKPFPCPGFVLTFYKFQIIYSSKQVCKLGTVIIPRVNWGIVAMDTGEWRKKITAQ